MKRVLTGTCLAAAFAVGLSAQTAPPQTSPQTPPTGGATATQDRDSAKNVTVTGCLKAGDTADSFVLSDLKWGSKDKDSKGSAVGTTGTAAPPAAVASATQLKLIPSASTKLSDHVGHQVEVSGSIADKASSPTAAPADPSAARPSSADAAINVRNVKMISATCSM
jgi:hypothetical protein